VPRRQGKKRKIEPLGTHSTRYIDTDHLIAYIYKERDKYPLVRKISTLAPIVIVSMVVIGEVINEILQREKRNEEISERIYKLVEIIKVMGADIQPASEEALKIALKCLEIDDRLKPTDAVIFAQALCDKDSVQLLTFDDVLTTSLRLQEFEEKLRKEGKRSRRLRISQIKS